MLLAILLALLLCCLLRFLREDARLGRLAHQVLIAVLRAAARRLIQKSEIAYQDTAGAQLNATSPSPSFFSSASC